MSLDRENPYESPAAPEILGPPPAAAEPTAALPARPRVWTVFTVFLIAEIVNIFAVVIVEIGLIMIMHGPDGLNPRRIENSIEEVMASTPGFLGMLVASQLVFIAAAVVPAALSLVPMDERLAIRPSGAGPSKFLIAFAGTLAIGLMFDGLSGLGVIPDSPALNLLSDFIAGLSLPGFVLAVLVIGLLPGLGEELLFRGYIQTRLSRRWGPAVGVIVASALFGLMHLDFVQGTFAFVLGIFLGHITQRSGSIRPAMFCHMANNSVACAMAYAGWEDPGFSTSVAFLIVSPVVLLASLVLYGRPQARVDGELAGLEA